MKNVISFSQPLFIAEVISERDCTIISFRYRCKIFQLSELFSRLFLTLKCILYLTDFSLLPQLSADMNYHIHDNYILIFNMVRNWTCNN